ncbi:farnesyl-diphosphate farnesyltransferase [Alicyclobacillus sacchari]|uniref:Farnesyl-diphosphate farnesyltransferase n=1 Tax=Alicyclobacillus sacchari TaxID=392010 RepID=A0A4R8LXE8_9BACL|nr:squalene/phytoene synthase family protein [Alicyclobacillus sacchari]TDY51376.1 farnesyl-diphosphate farnesyltransferase [Alicyclobacillus sacchari]GMA56701.1 phytoene desaturase [Alicyclobacillus sacchari]
MNMEQAYQHCTKLTRQAGSSFYYGMRFLPAHKRLAMYAIYAWSRICDDAVDDYEGDEAEEHLARAERMAEQAFADHYAASGDPIVMALGDTVRRFQLPIEPFRDMVKGMRIDMHAVRLQTMEELEQYCDYVAGTVGIMSVHIFGYRDPSALSLARDMGRALQLTNILRDLDEDMKRDRVYLPTEELAKHGYTMDDLRRKRVTPGFLALMHEQAERAKMYYEKAKGLFPLVEEDSLRCLRMLFLMYRELLTKIEESRFQVFDGRIALSSSRKLRLVWGVLWNASATV